MRALRAVIPLIVIASLLFTLPAAAHITMGWWVARKIETTQPEFGRCYSRGSVGQKEYGLSGITRFRAKFELRRPLDPGYIPYVAASTGWLYRDEFPNDARNFWATYEFWFTYKSNQDYWVREVLIGEVPSFWDTDRKIAGKVADVVCYDSIDAGT